MKYGWGIEDRVTGCREIVNIKLEKHSYKETERHKEK